MTDDSSGVQGFLERHVWAEPPAPFTTWADVLATGPDYYARTAELFSMPEMRAALPIKSRALILVALEALVSQLEPDRLARAIGAAVSAGADEDELTCVLELVSVIGLHSVSVGVPVLAEELERAGLLDRDAPYTPEQQSAVNDFEDSGPRPRPVDGMFDAIVRLDAEYFRRFGSFIDVPWNRDTLDPGFKHLICIAIDAACTHLHVDGLHRHIREALDLEVPATQILEVIQLASLTGLRTIEIGVPLHERARRGTGS